MCPAQARKLLLLALRLLQLLLQLRAVTVTQKLFCSQLVCSGAVAVRVTLSCSTPCDGSEILFSRCATFGSPMSCVEELTQDNYFHNCELKLWSMRQRDIQASSSKTQSCAHDNKSLLWRLRTHQLAGVPPERPPPSPRTRGPPPSPHRC